jgi:nitrogen fixation protein FixH
MPSPESQPVPVWKQYLWPGIVVAMLSGHAFLIVGALAIAAALIPAAVTAPDGYEAALGWDAQQAARRASDALGWTLLATPSDHVEVSGDRRVQFVLRDREGLPVENATITLTMYHHAKPNERIERQLEPQAVVGVYETVMPMRREGFWRIHAVAQQGEKRLLVDEDLWLGGTSP